MTVAVIAEKPAVARDIARVLGANRAGRGELSGNGYRVTWAIGHLVGLAEPHQIRPDWRRWDRRLLPMLPRRWPLVVLEETREQFEIVRDLLHAPDLERVICATDAGREGELIFRFVYEAAGCSKPVSRLWISSLTENAILEGFRRLRDGRELDALADAARARSQADWLVGMNLSRAYGLTFDMPLSVGRVQTPTLAMVVERELAIRRFVPEDYLEVVATFAPGPGASYQGTWFHEPKEQKDPKEQGEGRPRRSTRLPPDGEEARKIIARARNGRARIASVESETRRMPPPLLYDLTELQRHANRLFGFSAQRTLEVAQALYERHKLISYPRTSSRHLSAEVARTLPGVVEAIQGPYLALLAPETGSRPLGRRFVDDAQVTDHHAIIPTTTSPEQCSLSQDERRLFDLICRRLLAAWHDDFVWSTTSVVTEVHSPPEAPGGPALVDSFQSRGTAIQQPGWKVLDVGTLRPPKEKKKEKEKGKESSGDGKDGSEPDGAGDEPDQDLPAGLREAAPVDVLDAQSVAKKTRPPPHFTEATLLTAMESAGKTLDEKELSDAMKECGLGTPATRAATIETLLARGYLVRRGKALEATEKGIALVKVVDPAVKSPAMTGQWEARLQRIERGSGELANFMADIEDYVRSVVGRIPVPRPQPAGAPSAQAWLDLPLEPRPAAPAPPPAPQVGSPAEAEPSAAPPRAGRAPTPPDQLGRLLRDAFGFPSFRPHQEAVCRATTLGEDVLLVMPTGAGKSLCYQLPGIARGGTTLVVSPLISLMEDQVAKLRALGFQAERIHSGRERAEARRVCADYLAGNLDFLFIAPERLAVPGFPDLLARRKPCLIAIDEAHCISHWGHDFRPDYRLLGQRLPQLRPAPVIALTATATPAVQRDITQQLGLASSARTFIHGFRRDNLAIEALELATGERPRLARALLADATRRPAIVYAPTRKHAETMARELSGDFPAAAYHAGLDGAARDRVQAAFLAGELEVVVATVAFGMGVDKADVRTIIHLALPGSVEAYYQEIGRAGRDGKPSRAVLLHSFADRRTHEFFLERDYPPVAELERIFHALRDTPVRLETLGEDLRMDPDVFEKALEKLWIHGGAQVSGGEVARGRPGWQTPYAAMRAQRVAQLEQVARFALSHDCRMLELVRHFGDRADAGAPCGQCDACAPQRCIAVQFRTPSPEEARALERILLTLREVDGQGTGRLCRQLLGEKPEDRRRFDLLLGGLARAGLVQLVEDSFEKDGRRIDFQRACLTAAGRRAGAAAACALVPLTSEPSPAPPQPKRRRPGKAPSAPPSKKDEPARASSAPAALVEALRAWRLEEARRRKVPAFRILTNKTLLALAERRPRTERALQEVWGIGPKLAEAYGRALLALCNAHAG